MIRAFKNNTRIATAVKMAEGNIFQVYPVKQRFDSEEAFKAAYPEHEFKEETRDASEKTRQLTKAQKQLLIRSSLPRDTDTAMQKLVRQIYFQAGMPDSIRSTAIDWHTSYYGSRRDPGIYVQIPTDDRITPVYFNRKSGLILFDKKVQNDINPEGMRFYQKVNGDLIRVEPEFVEQGPDQKAVVYDNKNYATHRKYLKQLQEAGFYVVHYMSQTRPSRDVQEAMYKMIPHLRAVLTVDIYCDRFWIYPSRDNLHTDSWWRQTWVNPTAWIAENK